MATALWNRRSPEPREEIIEAVEISGLRGRGGAGFPTGRKWRAVAQQATPEKFVVANADEGDAGAYIDRFLIEDDPHALIEGMMLAGYAVGARKGWIYLRNEYPRAEEVLRNAIDEARARPDFSAQRVLGRDFAFDIDLVIGHGSYVCGEETALLRSIEGRRPEVMARPPYPTEHGLFGKPTLINNVETLVNVPWIVAHGGEAYRALGFSQSRGTKVVSLNSLFVRPGLYEIEFGVTVRQIVEELGGGLRGGATERCHHRRTAGRHHSAASARHALRFRGTARHRRERRPRRNCRVRRAHLHSGAACITSSRSARTSPAANARRAGSAAAESRKFLEAS